MNTKSETNKSNRPVNPATGKHIKSRAAIIKDAPKPDTDRSSYATDELWGFFTG